MIKQFIIPPELIVQLKQTVNGLNIFLQQMENETPSDSWITITEASRIISRSRPTTYKLIKSGALKAFRIENGRMRVKRSEVLNLIKNVQFKYINNLNNLKNGN